MKNHVLVEFLNNKDMKKAIKNFNPATNIWYITVQGIIYLEGSKEFIDEEYLKFEKIFNLAA